MKSLSIVKGTALLTVAGLIVKILGAVYRIVLARLIGTEGIGLYQMAYPVYLIFLSLSTAGLPLAISKIIAEQVAQGKLLGVEKVFKAALMLLSILGLLSAVGMFLAAPWLSQHVLADPRAVYAVRALAPAIFFISLMAVFRGYYQGWQDMQPTAISQILEQAVRVGVSLILATWLFVAGIEHAAAGAAFGATAGGAAGLAYLLWIFQKHRQKKPAGGRPARVEESIYNVVLKLVKFALPIAVAVILMPLLQTFDSIIVPNRLQSIGYSIRQATTMLGILGNSWAVVYLPMIVTAAISANLVPAIAAADAAEGQRGSREKISDGLRLAMMYLVPVAILVSFFGKSVYRTIYGVGNIGLLSWFAPAILFLGLEQVSAGVLQGLGRPKRPLLNFVSGAFVKVLVTIMATGWPGLNLAGAAIGTVCGAGITACLNLLAVKKLIHLKLSFMEPLVLAGLAMVIFCWCLKRWLQLHFLLEMIFVGIGGTSFYLVGLWLLGGIKSRDLEMLNIFFQQRRRPTCPKVNGKLEKTYRA